MAEFQPYPADHYLGVFLAQASEDEAAGYIAGRTYHVSGAPGCNCPHCQLANEQERLTRVQPPTLTARQVVEFHVQHAADADPRFRGDVEWAKRYLAECVGMGWIDEAEANEIRAAVGWELTPVQMRMF